MNKVAINGQAREDLGKKATKAVRNSGAIPCVLYGGGDAVHFSVEVGDVRDLVYTPKFKLAEIEVGGKKYSAILKDIQFHPVTEDILHIDFLALEDGRTVKVEVPIAFEGTSPGVRLGGKLQQNLRRIKIKTTPEHLVDHLTVNVSKLELGHAVRVRDIKPGEGIEIMSAPGTPVASVEIPRALRSASSAAEKAGGAEEGAEGAEGEGGAEAEGAENE